MEASEIQARATIAAALITAHAVEVPTISRDLRQKDAASRRLRELTDYVYEAITAVTTTT
jgi:hypothetical protein